MTSNQTVKIGGPISAVSLVNGPSDGPAGCNISGNQNQDEHQMAASKKRYDQEQQQMLQRQQQTFELAINALSSSASKLEEYQNELFKTHKKQIARLSVEIAERILRRKIDEGNYDIKEIIESALEHCPECDDVRVYLNSEDLSVCERLAENGQLPQGLKFKAADALGRAECRVETAKGTVDVLIRDQLERIEKALSEATGK